MTGDQKQTLPCDCGADNWNTRPSLKVTPIPHARNCQKAASPEAPPSVESADAEESPANAARKFAAALERIRSNWPHIEVATPRHFTDKRTTDPGAPACLRCKIEELIRG